MRKGIFVSFEGGEGAGKTTLIEKIFSKLTAQSYQVIQTREPGGTDLGEEIRQLLLHTKQAISHLSELALFLASRSQQVETIIRPGLEKGAIILCDRFNDSTYAYQGFARNLGYNKIKELCDFFSHQLHPDLTFFLDLPYELGVKRTSPDKDRIESEEEMFHEKVRQGFLKIAKMEPNRFFVIDASQTIEQVFAQAWRKLEEIL